ncbi:PLP-dependent aminotransferase family protein [Parendozoicomonas sp. Alg238-R29]|uniref:MocR-like pyridoxine biosynthesis transcription factor PdxR n=1 Tax=Parendozoicomonas sp. Alg238-R29 TaxID=2993446 RepID=UPI00248F13F4|nr:PLP-dependent aminotransferase family protein [Parendozoicomonas sp. Alg238-R29]
MATICTATDIRGLTLTGKNGPLFQELYQELKRRVLEGELPPGIRLPPSRLLAAQLNIGRNTVTAAFNQLLAEGYLQSKTGSGTYVADSLPEQWLHTRKTQRSSSEENFNGTLSNYGQLCAKAAPVQANDNPVQANNNPVKNSSFTVGVPDLKAFPFALWNKIQNQQSQLTRCSSMGFGNPAGLPALREAIADYLRTSRSVKCTPDQIVITNGAQQALALCARLLINEGEYAAIEEPGYRGAHCSFLAAGAQLQPCTLDEQGLMTEKLANLSTSPKVIYTSPAHQYPTGAILPLDRRLELLNWAARNNCWIIEDDYDSEYHYRNRPLASLQGLSSRHQVIYIGSFSKVLFPALRLGYLVLPESLVKPFITARQAMAGEIPLQTQATVSSFIREGHFSRHIRRMRLLYEKKQQILQVACRTLAPWCTAPCSGSGMHQVLYLKPELRHLESQLHKRLQEQGIYSSTLSSYFLGQPQQAGLVLGFANSSELEIIEGVATIRQTLNHLRTYSNEGRL